MKKNVRTIVASVVCLLVVLAGAILWTRSSQPVAGINQTQGPSTPEARASGLSMAATQDMADRNYAQAVEKLRQSLAIQPNPEIQMQLAFALLRVGKRTEAIQLLRSVAQGQSNAGQDAAGILAKVERDPNWGTDKR